MANRSLELVSAGEVTTYAHDFTDQLAHSISPDARSSDRAVRDGRRRGDDPAPRVHLPPRRNVTGVDDLLSGTRRFGLDATGGKSITVSAPARLGDTLTEGMGAVHVLICREHVQPW
ncbi:hypothetical protein [Streptomyces sp. NPDC059597]|uniref:hypothetical protein n=1 Tax=Streptomyces sp. NPDC059597 TaxID=3346879 RepID=UPI0036CD9460